MAARKALRERSMFPTLLITCTFCAFFSVVESTTVPTEYGDVKGVFTPHPDASGPFKSVSKFLGVPFAAPPTGQLRFKPPQPPKEWKPEVLQADKHGDICWQGNDFEFYIRLFTPVFSYSEDCLYLDIFTPNVSLRLPVLVYIHGGGYEGGASRIFPGDILALHGLVVVVIQYRLGPFGFLTTGDSYAPGNYGMLDQVQALKWVKENIEHFGGDPGKVTIFGESAGATSVSLHLLSPLSDGLFHQVIAESGVDLSPFAVQNVSFGLRFAKELAQNLFCTTSDYEAMVDCIRDKEGEDIQKAAAIDYRFYGDVRWAPVVDKHFLLDTPQNLRKKGDFKKVKLMISFNSHEGATLLGLMAKSSFDLTDSVEDGVSFPIFKEFVTKLAHTRVSGKENAGLVADALEFMYTPWPDNSDKYALRSQLVDLIGDYIYFAPSFEVADIHSKVASVYMYEFAHRPKNASLYPEWMGVVHGENVGFDFGVPLYFPDYDEADKNVSLFIMRLYANFAWYGNPTPVPDNGLTWEKYSANRRAYLRVEAQPKMATAFSARRMAFWNDYYPKLEQAKFYTEINGSSGTKAGVAMVMFLQVGIALILAVF